MSPKSQFKNKLFAEIRSGSEEGSYLRLKDFVSLNSRLESDKEKAEKPPIPSSTGNFLPANPSIRQKVPYKFFQSRVQITQDFPCGFAVQGYLAHETVIGMNKIFIEKILSSA